MYSTDAIVLKKIDTGEADAFFVCYTKDFGKIRALARGVKKESAKLKGHLETLSLSTIGLVEGRSGFQLTHASLANPWHGIRTDVMKLDVAFRIAALVDAECFERERDDALWRLLVGALLTLDREEDSRGSAGVFAARLKETLGYGRRNM